MTFETIYVGKAVFLQLGSAPFLLGATAWAVCITMGIINKTSKDRKVLRRFTSFLFSLVGITVLMFLFYWVDGIAADVSRSNAKALVSNIEQKYDVDEVQLQAFDTVTNPHLTSSQKVNVEVDGTTYMFYLTQDENTWEPTLEDPPVPGGSNAKPSITAYDLLKK